MNFLRYVNGCKQEDCIRNEDTQSPLQIFSISVTAEDYRHNLKTQVENYVMFTIAKADFFRVCSLLWDVGTLEDHARDGLTREVETGVGT